MLMNTFAALCAGFALNIILGSPPGILNLSHTIPLFNLAVEKRLARLYQNSTDAHRMAGVILLILTLLVFAVIPAVLIFLLYKPSPLLSLILDIILCWQSFSVTEPANELDKLSRNLSIGRTDLARTNLAKLTGSLCSDMNEDELIKRGVECAADCSADNAAGALFYMAIFGGIGGIVYKTVSILRRTYSVRSAASDDFGHAAHIIWTLLDFIPAHIGALFSIFTANIFGCSTEYCLEDYRRDRKHLKAAALAPCRCIYASALGISLTPKTVMQNGFISIQAVGSEERPADAEDVLLAKEIMFSAAFFTMLVFAGIKLAVILLI
ncbi:MAG: cobalamin biosynthesis protein [Ruminococcus sp.]|nr:cobalamin biosynthesis protein [Ruminococcus sp.]